MMEKYIDLNLCLTLSHGKPKLATEILAMLLVELPQIRTDINRALDESRFADARELAHKLYGACCYCGVPALKTICKKIELQLNSELKRPDATDHRVFNEVVDAMLEWQTRHNIHDVFNQK